MPKLIILSDGRPVYGSPGRPDLQSIPSFDAGAADVVLCVIDLTAWLGAATISDSDWTVTGATLGATTQGSTNVTAKVTMPTMGTYPADPLLPSAVTVQHAVTDSDGRVLNTTFRIYPQPR